MAVPRGPETVILPGGVQAPASFADLAERAAPSVVFVRTNQTHRYGTRRVLGRGLGSGFIIDPDGLILTNHHVVENAARVDVLLSQTTKTLSVVVEDDGVGFIHTSAMAEDQIGLFGMRERIEMLGGTFTIESSPGKGTTVKAEVPSHD